MRTKNIRSKQQQQQAPTRLAKSVKHMFKPVKHTTPNELKKSCLVASSTPNQTVTPSCSSITSSPIKSDRSIIKRNLFGIRLNHDQLNRDLKEMWKEQIERQKQQWNFDFEKLKPVSLSRASKSLNDLSSLSDQSKRYDWIRVNTYYAPPMAAYSSSIQSISLPDHLLDNVQDTDFVISAFDKNEIDYEHKLYKEAGKMEEEETETEEEEEDEALAVPQFYKYQRRLKLIKKGEADERKESKKIPKLGTKITKPILSSRRTRRSSSSEGKRLTQSLIITFSNNRKDTLRSAQSVKRNVKSEKKDKLKQQSLIDMFKNRKRRTSGSQQ